MSRIVILDTPTPGAKLKADVVVVGCGAGGSAVAGELRRLGRHVLVVEAGPLEAGVDGVRHVTDRGPVSKSYLSGYEDLVVQANAHPLPGIEGARSFHGPGGLMSRWAAVTPRPNLREEWDGTIDHDQMNALLDDAERLLHSTATDAFRGTDAPLHRYILERLWARYGGPESEAPADVIKTAARLDENGVLRLTGIDSLLVADAEAPDVTILAGYVVDRVLHDGVRAKGVRAHAYADEGGLEIDADVVVLAAGAIATPQILVASGMRTSPALGRNLMDHLMLYFESFDVSGEDVPARGLYEPILSVGLPVSAQRPFLASVGDTMSQYAVASPVDEAPPRELGVGILIGMEPRWDNRLIFDADDRDAFGLPAVRAQLTLSHADETNVRSAIALGYDMCRTLGNVWGVTNLQFGAFGSSLHITGTHRLGKDPEVSVADPNCRLWDWDNVYVAGNGTLGARNSANPTLTTVALGLRAARAIASSGGES